MAKRFLVLLFSRTTEITLCGTRAGGLFKSLDGGGKWEKIGAETLRGKIRSLAIDPVEPATMYIGTEPAGLLISDDEGRTWREAPGVREILKSQIRIRCRLSNRMFAGPLLPRRQGARYVNLKKSELYLSSNRGEHWQRIVGDLPNICSLCLQ
jgi:hypothetical protein